MDIIYNDTTQKWELKKEPYATIEVASEEDFDHLVTAINMRKEMKVGCGINNVNYCPCCHDVNFLKNEDGIGNSFCGRCGQKLDWSENDGMDQC